MRTLALLLLVASLALVGAGCGGDDEAASSTDEWAEELCTTIQDWMDELEQIGDSIGSELSRDAIEQAADDANAVTDEFVESIRDLGGPDTEAGDAVEEEIDEAADIVEDARDDIRAAIDEAEDGGISGVGTALGQIGASIAAMGNAMEQTLRTIDDADPSGEVQDAIDNSAACDELRN
jgi:archaellum component FlaC